MSTTEDKFVIYYICAMRVVMVMVVLAKLISTPFFRASFDGLLTLCVDMKCSHSCV